MKRAVFLDRDGTINVEKNYLYKPQDWEWIHGAIEAIRGFKQMGFLVIVVTNQAGIARNYYGQEDVSLLHDFVNGLLSKENAQIDAFYYCPHHPEFGERVKCKCRKPGNAMILQAKKDFNIDLNSSYMIGDRMSDILAGTASGLTSILVATGYGSREDCRGSENVIHAEDIYDAYEIIRKQATDI